jgi:hypothetical protein
MIKSVSISLLFIVFVFRIFSQELTNISTTNDAEFPGGEIALNKFIKDNMIIPESCLNEGKTGFVYVRFTVDTTGQISDIFIDSNQTNCKDYGMEAKRIVQLMPLWIPGKINGEPVKISYLLPVDFGFSEADVPEKTSKYVEPNWAGFELGITQLMNSSFESTFNENRYWENVVEKSWFLNYNFLEYKLPIYKQYLGITTGMGYSWQGVSFLSKFELMANSDTVYANSTALDLKRNKLTAHYLTLPLLLEFCSKRDTYKNFYFSSGVIGSWKFSSYSFQKGKDLSGNSFAHYVYSNYNLRNLNLDFVVRIGYSYLGVFTSYQLSSLFRKDKTVPIHPLRIGLTINMDYFKE